MSNNTKNIKTLRENFLKRHQLDYDFFTVSTQQEHSFADDALFYQFDRIRQLSHHQNHNQTTIKGSPIPLHIRHRHSSSDHPLQLKVKCLKSN